MLGVPIVYHVHGWRGLLENVPQLCQWAQTVAPGGDRINDKV